VTERKVWSCKRDDGLVLSVRVMLKDDSHDDATLITVHTGRGRIRQNHVPWFSPLRCNDELSSVLSWLAQQVWEGGPGT
jgi:hypothetical protein